jgi:hypothetical protein
MLRLSRKISGQRLALPSCCLWAARTAPEVGLLAARGPLQLWLYDKPAL